jgi:YVTN family beta-propeller protein
VGLEDSCIVEIDTASLLPLRTIVLPAAEAGPVTHLLVHPDEDRLYAVAGSQGFLLDGRTGATLAQLDIAPASGRIGLIQTWGLSYDGQRLLTLDFAGERVLVLEASSGRLLTALPLCSVRSTSDEVHLLTKPQGPHWRAARFALEARTTVPLEVQLDQSPHCLAVWYDDQAVLSPDGRYLCTWLDPHPGTGVSNPEAEIRIQPIKLGRTHWVTHSLPAGISAVSTLPGRDDLYVLNEVQDTLTIFAPYDDGRQSVVPVGEKPEALIVSAGGTRAYVANRQSETISVVDLAQARVVHTIPLSGQPLSLALQDARDRP